MRYYACAAAATGESEEGGGGKVEFRLELSVISSNAAACNAKLK